ncbi:MAG TPA: acetoin utilization protein AcuC, partial [Actinomycetota bacterium]|nr:acetoin utilization protein AcuC [Actinomycetota bacterium]
AGGRWVATGGGGYQWARVVPRAWTIYFAEMAGEKIPDEIPASWIEAAEREAGYQVPGTLSEPPTGPGDPSAVNRVVERVRRTIFPAHGLSS